MAGGAARLRGVGAGDRGDAPPLSMGPGGLGLIPPTEPAENFGGFYAGRGVPYTN